MNLNFLMGSELLELYQNVALTIERMKYGKTSLQNLVLNSPYFTNKKIIYKLVIAVIEHSNILSFVLRENFPEYVSNNSDTNTKENTFIENRKKLKKKKNEKKKKNSNNQKANEIDKQKQMKQKETEATILKTIIFDMCLGDKIQNPTQISLLLTQFLTTNNPLFQKSVQRRNKCLLSIEKFMKNNNGMVVNQKTNKKLFEGVVIPKYFRLNMHVFGDDYKMMKQFTRKLRFKFEFDDLMHENLLVCTEDVIETRKVNAVQRGELIVHDKGSCLPVFVLFETVKELKLLQGGIIDFVDSCASPGNKTSYLSEYYVNSGDTGTVFAFERDESRYKLLTSNMYKYGIKCVKSIHKDFLKVNTKDQKYKNVRAVIVDPSCSGSGITTRISMFENDYPEKRIQSLANFQTTVLLHALTFPNVEVVMYSTCSIFEKEDEGVVREVLSKRKDFDIYKVLENIWNERGKGKDKVGRNSIRTEPRKHHTNGFYVACLVKKSILQKGNTKKRKRTSKNYNDKRERIKFVKRE